MITRRARIMLVFAGVAAVVAAGGVAARELMPGPPGPRPAFELPVACNETWTLSTYPGHDPYDIDFYPTSGEIWGRPVLASFAGTVVDAGINGQLGDRTPDNPKGEQGRGGGYWVKLDHGGRWETLYLHLLEPPLVQEGQRVERGDQLGRIGSTGNSSAPHLHYEQLRAGDKVESHFGGVPAGITDDDREYEVKHKSANC